MNKTVVIYHRADFDGIFCREIARKFLPDSELIGWDFGDTPIPISLIDESNKVYVLDLPVDRVFGSDFTQNKVSGRGYLYNKVIWIDHHKSSIESHPTDFAGYRIDGVAACRLAWQWFMSIPEHAIPNFAGRGTEETVPSKQQFIDRMVIEPTAVRLAGEYDIWDKRDPDAELFQHGLRSQELTTEVWGKLLDNSFHPDAGTVNTLLQQGRSIQYAKTRENESIITRSGFTAQFEGLTFLACNHASYNSFLFTAGLKPEHDALLGFCWRANKWVVSLYHAPGKEHHDLSLIASKYGGGGHRGACGFTTDKLQFLP